ncbi:hypothetical protein [Kutzneria buriramensis]|uniref:Uncharacterized protein n=1 Tax=Kutzneria buriramensis TaxID=1045776 RepID=A0A3E0GVI4_9PSEU|nr:hypothetical protein [Kutzneria buriramensis]REH30669.1 hypothetical protein BCF44_12327 [Kutzneria buriramensis]
MPDEMILTFAEIEFLLRSREPKLDVRKLLRIKAEAAGDVVAAAGLASLLARDLCVETHGKVKLGREIAAIAAVLVTADIAVNALGWIGEDMVLLHVFSCPGGQLSFRAVGHGRFAVEVLAPDRPLSAGLVRLMDLCLTGDGESAVLLKMETTASEPISMAVARGVNGEWHLSDSALNATSSREVTPEAARARVVEVFDGDAAAVGGTR